MKKMRINGPIVNDEDAWIYNWFGVPCVSPKAVTRFLDRAEKERDSNVLVLINSGGGSVFAASEIYHALKSHSGKVVVEITGIAGSAASVIGMAGDDGEIAIAPTAQIMIHNAAMGNHGDYHSMDAASDLLQNANKSIMNAYIRKTGKSEEELKAMMDKETWMTAQQALENGFVDRVLFDDHSIVTANGNPSGTLPNEVIKEMRSKLASGEISIEGKVNGERDPANIVNSIPDDKEIQNKEGEEDMDLKKIKNEYPELYQQIKNEGYEEGASAENNRIKEIEDLAMPGNEDVVNEAKFGEKIDAKDLAMKIIKAEKEKGTRFMQNAKLDSSSADEVGASNGNEGVDGGEISNSKSKIESFMAIHGGAVNG